MYIALAAPAIASIYNTDYSTFVVLTRMPLPKSRSVQFSNTSVLCIASPHGNAAGVKHTLLPDLSQCSLHRSWRVPGSAAHYGNQMRAPFRTPSYWQHHSVDQTATLANVSTSILLT